MDAILILDGDLVICGGAVAATMREAVDQLSSRLRRRITALCERDERSTSRSYEMAATTAAT